MSVVVFLRKDFGKDYVNWVNLFFGYSAIGFFVQLGMWESGLYATSRYASLTYLFYLAFIILSIGHRWEAMRKRKKGIKWHTEYSGTSLIKLPVSRDVMNKWIEPAVVFAAAVFMYMIHNRAMEAWLALASVALLLHEHISYFLQEQKVDELADAQIEAEYWKAAMEGKPSPETGGFVIASSTIHLLNRTPDVKDAFANLAPDLKKIMQDANDKGRAA
jgi:hypothetical protein